MENNEFFHSHMKYDFREANAKIMEPRMEITIVVLEDDRSPEDFLRLPPYLRLDTPPALPTAPPPPPLPPPLGDGDLFNRSDLLDVIVSLQSTFPVSRDVTDFEN